MRTIYKKLTLPVEGEQAEFRLRKFDAFSGVSLLRLALKYLPENNDSEGRGRTMERVFTAMTEEELHGLLRTALNHTEVLLPAGYQPVMVGEDWGWEPLEHDAAACLRLAAECARWSLEGFFTEAGSNSPGGTPAI